MRELVYQGAKAMVSLVRRLLNRVAHDITADFEDVRQWSSQKVPPAVVLVTEKWLGFWYAFLITFVIGALGMAMIETARWASDIPDLASVAPRLVLWIGGVGFLVVLLWGITMSTLLLVSAARAIFWTRNWWTRYWRSNTPPYRSLPTEPVTGARPPSKDEQKRALKRSWEYFKKGAFSFPAITIVLLLAEQNFADQLYPAVRNYDWSSVTEIVSINFFIFDIEGVAGLIGSPLDPIQLVGFVLIFAVPGTLLAVSTRNLMFYTESRIRESIQKASEGSKLHWRRFWLSLQMVASSLYAAGVLAALLYGK